MPKQKTRRSAAKRFKTTGSGKLRRRKAWRGHLVVGKKSSSRLRRLEGDADVHPSDEKRVRRMLGK
jgi:large subunit ribosomal protein L35